MRSSRRVHLSILWFFLFSQWPTTTSAVRKSYVVYMGSHPRTRGEGFSVQTDEVTASHYEFLGSFLGSKEKAQEAIFYSYTRYINGFAAVLDEKEAMEISKSPRVMTVFPNEGQELHTTRSWEFLGLEVDGIVTADSIWTKARFGEDTIIGNLDTGVWPESTSFNDKDLGPVPSRWKGICENGPNDPFRCNRKLIGARSFNKGYVAAVGTSDASVKTTRDFDGHGTHTLSIAGGAFAPGASLFGFGNGTAKGGSPNARLAAYKVCWPILRDTLCFDADTIAAFDAAIHDGVDVLSVSLGGPPSDYLGNGIAIGSFHAVKNGITVVCSGGNYGPYWETVSNVAPWIFTVAASTVDREFPAYAVLGNGKQLKGQSFSSTILPPGRFYPLITSLDARAPNSTLDEAAFCFIGALDPQKVKGKIVVCFVGNVTGAAKSRAVLLAGGVGMLLPNIPNQGNNVIAQAFVLPPLAFPFETGASLRSPVASIRPPTTALGTKPAPFMAYFSSRGPNVINPEILKPDITAPGVSILAAFTEAAGPSNEPFDTRTVPFNSLSGTSMSCPHISGVAGLLKTLHPDWSPAAIKSAIMTTATTEDNQRNPILDSFFFNATPFSYGAGHDYLDFLCVMGYSTSQVAAFSGTSFSCPLNPRRPLDLNYPSITVPRLSGRTTVWRKVKNVGTPGKYAVHVNAPPGISVTVDPVSIEFTDYGQEESFNVTLEANVGAVAGEYVYGRLTWSDMIHNVTSPLVIGIV
ncbi:unnamed protein product [Spirodela intermedia]|uniref:Uncharacterized protein n=1 Tax=Spirodela intermedia TaxID=51605 RepID=A0A7I8JRK8_SPIIN|nr:unnamed protein product [Spirodela intermedia]CAA6672395.1 unnamed protein product [Spirodela intermedia]